MVGIDLTSAAFLYFGIRAARGFLYLLGKRFARNQSGPLGVAADA
ncbi:MAG: hypothetical protein R2861_04340 [Desulfobacterales bacterium]